MDIIKELWLIAYEKDGKQVLAMLSMRSSYEKAKNWAEMNIEWLKDKDWFIVKYELAEDF